VFFGDEQEGGRGMNDKKSVLLEKDAEMIYPCKPDIFEKTYEPAEDNAEVDAPSGAQSAK
jgi:hypothetical protein